MFHSGKPPPSDLDPYLDAEILPPNCELRISTTPNHARIINISDGRVRMVFNAIRDICRAPMTQGEIEDTRHKADTISKDEKDWLVEDGEYFGVDNFFMEFRKIGSTYELW
jgi:hypothetical protein